MARLGEVFPNFDADTTEGRINFHQWIGDSWAILFSHPADFTPVCTTELARVVNLKPEFDKRGIKLIAISLDSVEDHKAWSKDVLHIAGASDCNRPLPYPIIADKSRELAVQLQMLDPNEIGKEGLPLPARTVFLIGPDKKLKMSILYPATTGRNFDEIIRAIDSIQLTAKNGFATPVNWRSGDDCIVPPSIKTPPAGTQVKELPSGKQYLRYMPGSGK